MRKILLLLFPLLLIGCTDNSARYASEGGRDVLAIRAAQEYFWNEELSLTLIASRMPDCQRQFPLTKATAAELQLELFAGEENRWVFRLDKQLWLVDMQACTVVPAPADALVGDLLGIFKVQDGPLIFEVATAKPVATATAPAAADPAAVTAAPAVPDGAAPATAAPPQAAPGN